MRATAPDGSDWEIYAYRIQLRKRGATFDPGLAGDDPVGVYSAAEAELDALDAILWLLGLIPRLLVRLLWDLPCAGIAALAPNSCTVEAVTWYPVRTSYRWITPRARRQEVVAEVRRQIVAGQLPPKPRHARYVGEER